jgi:choline dehydrogenase-like flavoprotein
MRAYDAIVVGARCAGAVLAARLADAGSRVLLVDRATFPSDTLSTHFLFPSTLQRLQALGVMERLHASHDIPRVL